MRWLWCLAQYELMQHLGPAALVVLKGLLVALAFALVALPVARRANLLTTSVVLFVAILASSERLLVRPELVTWLLFGAFVFILDRQRDRGSAIYLLPLLQVVWVNSHPTFLLGPLLVGLSLVVRGRTAPLRRPLCIVLACTFAACLVNPYGVEGLLVPLRQFAQIRESVFKEVISEVQSPFTFGLQQTAIVYYWILVALCAVSATANWRRLEPFWLLLCASQLYLSTLAIRNLTLFSLAAVPFVVSNLEHAALHQRIPAVVARSGRRIVALAVIAGCAWYVWQIATDRFSVRQNDSKQFGWGISEHRYPVEAADFLDRSGLDGRVFATLLESSYLIARGRQVFADPRGDVYDDARFRRYMAVQRDPEAWRAAVEEYDIRIAVVSLGSRLVELLGRNDQWKLVFFDTVAAVYVRRDALGSLTPLASEEEFDRALAHVREQLPPPRAYASAGPFERVTNPKPYLALADLALWSRRLVAAEKLLDEAERASPYLRGIAHRRAAIAQARRDYPPLLIFAQAALEETPDDPQALYALGEARLRLGRLEEAAAPLRRAAEQQPADPRAWDLLGQLAMLRQDHAAAAGLLARAVELSPSDVSYRNNLARSLAVSGRKTEAISQLDSALRLEPDNVTVLRDLAILHLERGEIDRAQALLDRALLLAPDDAELARMRQSIAP